MNVLAQFHLKITKVTHARTDDYKTDVLHQLKVNVSSA